jgi:hypothetical protein
LMNPMMRVMVRRSNAQFIENLKRLLET